MFPLLSAELLIVLRNAQTLPRPQNALSFNFTSKLTQNNCASLINARQSFSENCKMFAAWIWLFQALHIEWNSRANCSRRKSSARLIVARLNLSVRAIYERPMNNKTKLITKVLLLHDADEFPTTVNEFRFIKPRWLALLFPLDVHKFGVILLIINYCYPHSSCVGNDVETKDVMRCWFALFLRFTQRQDWWCRQRNFWREFMSGSDGRIGKSLEMLVLMRGGNFLSRRTSSFAQLQPKWNLHSVVDMLRSSRELSGKFSIKKFSLRFSIISSPIKSFHAQATCLNSSWSNQLAASILIIMHWLSPETFSLREQTFKLLSEGFLRWESSTSANRSLNLRSQSFNWSCSAGNARCIREVIHCEHLNIFNLEIPVRGGD